MSGKVIVVGGGIFGLTSAWELQKRGYSVTLLDPGSLPNPNASSTDISKVVRMDYGADDFYMRLMEESLAEWRNWNTEFGERVFHETGVLFLAKDELSAGGFEYENLRLLAKRGHSAELLDSSTIARRFPAWNADLYPVGYFNPQGGWAPSGRVVSLIAARAKDAGVSIFEGAKITELLEASGKVQGVITETGENYEADWVVIAAGTWTQHIVPELKAVMRSVAQPVMHFRSDKADEFRPPYFPVWTADVGRTGWYGFPANKDGALKIANHGPGSQLDPNKVNTMPGDSEAPFRDFLRESLPSLTKSPKIYERLCFYCDTFDGDFWISRDPEREGLVVSTGGSGHAFKFAPMLGQITADVVEGKENQHSRRFAWREPGEQLFEAARNAS
jgi:glycine/D-amino acid oxidase-like deaminating enzyme